VSSDLAVRDGGTVTLWSTDNPEAALQQAARIASAAMHMIETQGLVQAFGQGRHVKVDGWLCIARLANARTHVEWERPLRDDSGNVIRDGQGRPFGWEASVQVLNQHSEVVGDAVSQCARDESNWRSRDDYAVRSMAQTRATGKALRVALGFVAAMAGFDATPAEELPPRAATAPRAEPTPPPAPHDEVLEGEVIEDGASITRSQHAQIAIRVKKLTEDQEPFPAAYEDAADWVDVLRRRLRDAYGVESRKDLTGAQADDLIEWLKKQELPFA
jgi:hypothetical protein